MFDIFVELIDNCWSYVNLIGYNRHVVGHWQYLNIHIQLFIKKKNFKAFFLKKRGSGCPKHGLNPGLSKLFGQSLAWLTNSSNLQSWSLLYYLFVSFQWVINWVMIQVSSFGPMHGPWHKCHAVRIRKSKEKHSTLF